MTTLDKINSELASLQDELSQLQHYTAEIGRAKEASTLVVKMSKDFISSFQKRVDEINTEMAKASADFTKMCGETSTSLEDANNTFQKEISEAKNILGDVGTELAIVAEKVNELAVKIESIDILGHFEKIHSSITEVNSNLNTYFGKFNSTILEFTNEQATSNKRNKRLLWAVLLFVVIGIALGLFTALKVGR